jgi:hypothetical protein
VLDKALYENLDDFGRIEHLMAVAEARLITIVRELDRHRATVAALRRFRPLIEEGKFKVIESTARIRARAPARRRNRGGPAQRATRFAMR